VSLQIDTKNRLQIKTINRINKFFLWHK